MPAWLAFALIGLAAASLLVCLAVVVVVMLIDVSDRRARRRECARGLTPSEQLPWSWPERDGRDQPQGEDRR